MSSANPIDLNIPSIRNATWSTIQNQAKQGDIADSEKQLAEAL